MSKLLNNIYQLFIYPFVLLGRLLSTIIEKIGRSLRLSISLKISISYIKILFNILIFCFVVFLLLLTFLKVEYNYVKNQEVKSIIYSKEPSLNFYMDVSSRYNVQLFYFNEDNNLEFATSNMEAFIPEWDISFTRYNKNNFYFSKYALDTTDNKDATLGDVNKGSIVVVAYNITRDLYEMAVLILLFLALGLIILVFTSFVGIRTNRRRLLPVYNMTQTLKNISTKNLNTRINVSGAENELKDLALTFNNMLNNIEESYNKQQQFVSDASHELRTPIAVIQGYANMLERWGKKDEAVLQESIDAILSESNNMKSLVEKLLFIARNDKDTLKVIKSKFNLTELIQEMYKETQMIDSNHIISLGNCELVFIIADKELVKQAIRIFIDNAIKYTPEKGNIYIGVELEENYAVVIVKDSGVGISKEELIHVFDRFYRSDKSRSRHEGGHGLGLAIAKIIVSRHTGKIKVRSKVGEGTEFKIYLPIN